MLHKTRMFVLKSVIGNHNRDEKTISFSSQIFYSDYFENGLTLFRVYRIYSSEFIIYLCGTITLIILQYVFKAKQVNNLLQLTNVKLTRLF